MSIEAQFHVLSFLLGARCSTNIHLPASEDYHKHSVVFNTSAELLEIEGLIHFLEAEL